MHDIAYFPWRNPEPLDIGTRVRLAIHLTRHKGGKVRETEAEVVRVEALEPDRAALWSHRVAVHFDQPLSDIEYAIEVLAERLARAGLPD